MTVLRGVEEDRFLRPGTLVRLSIMVNDQALIEPDYGVVVHCWRNFSHSAYDCLVAFLGEPFSVEGPLQEPYVSTFSAHSLADIPSDSISWPVHA